MISKTYGLLRYGLFVRHNLLDTFRNILICLKALFSKFCSPTVDHKQSNHFFQYNSISSTFFSFCKFMKKSVLKQWRMRIFKYTVTSVE